MKKSLFLCVVLALMLCFSCGVFADAAVYDYGTTRDCNYTVYVATVDGGVNLREAPTTDAYIITLIPDFVQLQITMESTNGNGWGYTCYNGNYGWVALSQVKESFPIKQTSYDVVITGSSVNLREGPYTSYSSYTTIPYGTEVHVGATYNGWGEVYYNGEYGWIALKYTVAAEDFVWEEETQGDVMPIEEEAEAEPVEDEAAVTSLDKEDGGGNPMVTMILLGMIVLVVVVAAVLIIVILARKK